MSTLPDKRIIEYAERIVEPFNHERVQPASYDLALGQDFIRFSAQSWHVIDLANMEDESPRKVHFDDQFVIEPGEFVLGLTEEIVRVPDNMVGRLEGKSTIGRVGLLIHVTAGFVDPGWEGRLTLEIYNVRRVPIVLRPGLPICQMSWAYMEPPDKPYAGRYQGADTVESSKDWDAKRRGTSMVDIALKYGAQARSGGSQPPVLSSNHPAMGMLSQDEMDESGYDGPMWDGRLPAPTTYKLTPCCNAPFTPGESSLSFRPGMANRPQVPTCSNCGKEVT